MTTRFLPDGTVVPPLNTSAPAPVLNLRGFNWKTVDAKFTGAQLLQERSKDGQLHIEHQEVLTAESNPPPLVTAEAPSTHLPVQLEQQLLPQAGKPKPAPPGFPLQAFKGTYAGNGFNTIFRPRADPGVRDSADEKAHGLGAVTNLGNLPDDNILELNFTLEQLTFGDTIGGIPNRGFAQQKDITLGGLPYLQTIQDVTDVAKGTGNNPEKTDIHFEPGMWLLVPKCDNNPTIGASIVRMASIPHGTTIHAQGLAPTPSPKASGPPVIDDVDITPTFLTGGAQPFPSMIAKNKGTARMPQNLDTFIAKGTITDDIIKNPNMILKKAIKNMKIIDTITFEVSTGPPTGKVNGGGTANISFLLGNQVAATEKNPFPKVSNPNAHAAFMSSKFWIETVEYELLVDGFTSPEPKLVTPIMPNTDAPTPSFLVMPPAKLPAPGRKIKARGTQIQYSQTVNLVFGPLRWPHVSVATLVPTTPQVIQLT